MNSKREMDKKRADEVNGHLEEVRERLTKAAQKLAKKNGATVKVMTVDEFLKMTGAEEAKKEKTVTISLTKEEMIYLNGMSNIANMFEHSTGFGHKAMERYFPDMKFDDIKEGFDDKMSEAIHKEGWCPDPTCEHNG